MSVMRDHFGKTTKTQGSGFSVPKVQDRVEANDVFTGELVPLVECPASVSSDAAPATEPVRPAPAHAWVFLVALGVAALLRTSRR